MIIAFREISAIDGRFVKRFAIHGLPADRPDILPQRLVSGRHRILEQRVEARREVLEVVGIELEAETLRLLESSAAPRSPVHLVLEGLAPFVDGKGMIGVLGYGGSARHHGTCTCTCTCTCPC